LIGKLQLVKTLLQRLGRLLTSNDINNESAESASIDTFLATPLDNFFSDNQVPLDSFVLTAKVDTERSAQAFHGFDISERTPKSHSLGDTTPKRLETLLEKASLPYITSNEQIQLALIVDCMNDVC
jgi:hypothetical protein